MKTPPATSQPPIGLKSVWQPRESFFPLLSALVFVLIMAPLTAQTLLLPSLLVSAMLLSGVFAVVRSRTSLWFVVAGLICSLSLRWLVYFVGEQSTLLVVLTHLAMTAYLVLLFVLVVRRVASHPLITRDTVLGAVCGYLLLAFVFGTLYATVISLAPGALQLGPTEVAIGGTSRFAHDSWALIYFSFSTLTTLGYGDILPVSPLARSLATLEVLTGQLYLAAFVAWLVGAIAATTRAKQGVDGTFKPPKPEP